MILINDKISCIILSKMELKWKFKARLKLTLKQIEKPDVTQLNKKNWIRKIRINSSNKEKQNDCME